MRSMNRQDVINQLKALVDEYGSQKALADEMGITASYLSDILNGKRDPGKSVLDWLGLERSAVLVYTKKK